MKLGLILLSTVLLLACEPVLDEGGFSYDDTSKVYDVTKPTASMKATAPKCGDKICQESENKCTCPADCGTCAGIVSSNTEWACVQDECKIIKTPNICGNGICEDGEFPTCRDCPSCDDNDVCTIDTYSFKSQSCAHDRRTVCCGDKICSAGEESTCLADCSSRYDLSDYPIPFVKDGTFQAHLIVGSSGEFQSELIISAISIMNGLEYDDVKTTYSTDAKLDTEIGSITNRNVILVGSPCQNSYVKDLMPYTSECDEAIPSSGSLVRLFKTGSDTYAIAVMGKSGPDVRDAGRFLERYESKKLSGVEAYP